MGYLNLGSLINDDGITFPHTIEGTMDLSSLITINNSTLPKHLTGYLNLSRLNNLTNLKIPTDFKGKILTSFGIFTKEELEQYQTNNISTTKLK